jgi:hypothetical protein
MFNEPAHISNRAVPLRQRPFDLPQNASATAMPIIAEARTHQNQHFFSTLLEVLDCGGRLQAGSVNLYLDCKSENERPSEIRSPSRRSGGASEAGGCIIQSVIRTR